MVGEQITTRRWKKSVNTTPASSLGPRLGILCQASQVAKRCSPKVSFLIINELEQENQFGIHKTRVFKAFEPCQLLFIATIFNYYPGWLTTFRQSGSSIVAWTARWGGGGMVANPRSRRSIRPTSRARYSTTSTGNYLIYHFLTVSPSAAGPSSGWPENKIELTPLVFSNELGSTLGLGSAHNLRHPTSL